MHSSGQRIGWLVSLAALPWLGAACGSGDTTGYRPGTGGIPIAGSSSTGAAESGGASESGGAAGSGTGGAAGDGACVVGDERCDCYPNGTCNGTLRCLSGLCVDGSAATGGDGGTGTDETGGVQAGGTAGSGDTSTGGTAATAGAGGNPAGNGGTTGDTGGGGGTTGDTGGNGGTTSGTGGTTGGTGGTTGGTGSCFAVPDYYVDRGGILGYVWGYYAIDGEGGNVDLHDGVLALDYTLSGTTYDEMAIIGFNLNQPTGPGEDPTYGHDIADEAGICVFGTGFDRITVEDDSGGSWCVEHTGCAVWSEFTEECWDSGPEIPANATIYRALAVQPEASPSSPARSASLTCTCGTGHRTCRRAPRQRKDLGPCGNRALPF